MSEGIITVQSCKTKGRLSAIFKDSAISFHSLLTRFRLAGGSDPQTNCVFESLRLFFPISYRAVGYPSLLSYHCPKSDNQLSSTNSALATPVNAVMSLCGVKELVMGADRLENGEKRRKGRGQATAKEG